MRPSITFYDLKEKHWEYNPDNAGIKNDNPKPTLEITRGGEVEAKLNIVRFRWNYQHSQDTVVLLSFIADQAIKYENIHLFTVEDVKRMVFESWFAYSKEIFKRLKDQNIKVSFSLFDMTQEELEKLLQSLK